MLKRVLLVVAGVVLVGTVALGLGARRIFGSDRVRVAIERQATEALGQPVRVGSAAVSVFPRVGVDLGRVSIGEPAAVTLERVAVATGLRALLSRRIEGAEIVVADSRLALTCPSGSARWPVPNRRRRPR